MLGKGPSDPRGQPARRLPWWYTGHLWSLSVEEHYYLAWPLLLRLCGSRRARPVVVVLALLVPVWGLVRGQLGWGAEAPTTGTDVRIDAILWGCWARWCCPSRRTGRGWPGG